MDRAGDRRGTASGLRPAPPGRRGDPRDADRYARDDDARSRESASESDGASEASEEGSVSPEDAELLAKLEAEAAADKDADKEALAAFEKMDRARRRTILGALYRVFAAPARLFEEVYASPDSLMTFSRTSPAWCPTSTAGKNRVALIRLYRSYRAARVITSYSSRGVLLRLRRSSMRCTVMSMPCLSHQSSKNVASARLSGRFA